MVPAGLKPKIKRQKNKGVAVAIFHMSFKILKRSEGKSAVYLSAYQNREKTIDNRTGATWDYSKKEGFFGSTILSPAGTPAELVRDSGTLWNAVEAAESRKVRDITPSGFGNKNRDWNKKENVESWRNNWEISANKALKKYGHKSRIDSRSLEEQKEEAERKAVFAKTPKEKAKWISKSIELDRTPMTRIHRHKWKEGQKLRKMEQEEKRLLYKKASLTYHQMTKPIEPEQSMKIEKSQIAQKIKSIFETAKNKINSKIADFFKPKPKKETPEKFVSSYEIDELGKEKEESEKLRLKEEDQKLKNTSKPTQQNNNSRKLKR